jgi:glutamate synthase (NADPH) large chain
MMSHNHTELPRKQGLYDPAFEHDACGIGFVANLKAKASHDIVEKGLHILCQLTHRGGENHATGDGSGIMVQIPHQFLKNQCAKIGISLPEAGQYGVGMLFLPHEPSLRTAYEEKLEQIAVEEGQTLLGWRTVPVNHQNIGETARKTQPVIRQVFIANSQGLDPLAFERKLYVIRKRMEREAGEDFYAATLSSRTLVYKGLLTPSQLGEFYPDLQDPLFASAFSMVHNRFSTNTFPSWKRAHPNRYLLHNGEINTLRGNVNWMLAREKMFQSDVFGQDLDKIFPVLDMEGTDSSILDNCFEFMTLSGRSLAHTAMMMIPEPWEHDGQMSEARRSFYAYHSCLMEPWDGPTAIAFTDGTQIGALLDRNGLRPARYYVTSDDLVIFSSEVGVVDVPEEKVVRKARLQPGRMLLVSLDEGRIIDDEELKEQIATEAPYGEWLRQHMVELNDLPGPSEVKELATEELVRLQKAFGYTYEEITKNLAPMVTEGKDPVGAMGSDTPLAVLSDRPQLLYNYFKQSFAQVTNPPIDAIREQCVTSTTTLLGAEGNLLKPTPTHCRRIRLSTPILADEELGRLAGNTHQAFKTASLSMLFPVSRQHELAEVLEELFSHADAAIDEGATLLILTDRGVNEEYAAIPALLAVSGLHHHLVRRGTRTKVSLLVESAEPRDVHQLAMLLGYGADAINPYLAIATYKQMIQDGALPGITYAEAVRRYITTATEGIVKVMSKMGISTIQSYRGAQIFEAIGIGKEVIDTYFTRTSSQIGGIQLDVISQETVMRHAQAFDPHGESSLEAGSELQWRRNGEPHAYNPLTIHTLQQACRRNDYALFKKFTQMANDEHLLFLRSLFAFKSNRPSIPIEEVEPVESIVRRFKTGAMSYGALSQEAHEALAIAMNRLGGKSNSGEGGEDPRRYQVDANGDSRRSAIKQVASGRFGVNSHYLVNADEIQIKMAQGAKPGEGGQLPGNKVYPWIAEVRGSTVGVGLISPPPHHDIYSIEDLAQLIHDLKNANPQARISVKLVSKAGVGTIAAGVAKGLADVIVISGHDGGTGASPRTSIKHAGMPWELGLAEAHQTLQLNQLRDRVVLETDGKMLTGRDVVMAALLGAEEYGFATAPLVVLGCVMMRVCHLDTCPVGVATQNPELRRKFTGDPEHVVNYLRFVAQEVREIMAELGFRTVEEMVGRTDVLTVSDRAKSHWKAKHLDLSPIFYQPQPATESSAERSNSAVQDHHLEKTLDCQQLLPLCQPALEQGTPVKGEFTVNNNHRVIGTILGSEVTKRYGEQGLPEDTIHLSFKGSAGQSFGAFIPKGITLNIQGDANDYVGKGLSGGKIIVKTPSSSPFNAHENIIIGNVAFYGASSGEAYINGMAGERFCVRNSGVHAVVEGIGDHGCEYMTGGRVVVLGSVGKNFAAGMSGGIAYVLAEEMERFYAHCNQEMVLLERLVDKEEIEQVREMIAKHVRYTHSRRGQSVLAEWEKHVPKFIKVIPRDYKAMKEAIETLKQTGLSLSEAKVTAFNQLKKQRDQQVKNHVLVTTG